MIEVVRQERVVHLAIDVPKVNVLDTATLEELAERLSECGADEGVAAVVLEGTGRCFSAGASVAEHRPDSAPAMVAALRRACLALAELPCPAIAAVHGACLGGAMELVSCCDFVVADPEATFGQPEIKLAFFPPIAALQLPRLAGLQNAAYAILTGETLSAAQAMTLGVVQKIVARDEWGWIDETFNRLSAAALRLAKQALRRGAGDPDREALDAIERLFLTDLYRLEDVGEGIASFEERRRPAWKHC